MEKSKKTRLKIGIAALSMIALATMIAIAPVARKIELTLTATEYSFADADYAKEHTVVIQGYDTRNYLGRGMFVGKFAVGNWENSQEGWSTKVEFPMDDYTNSYVIHPSGDVYTTSDIFSMQANRDWTQFVALIQEYTIEEDGVRRGSFSFTTGRFLVSGTADRETALDLAARIVKGTPLSPVFEKQS